jgi:hypothetical protein
MRPGGIMAGDSASQVDRTNVLKRKTVRCTPLHDIVQEFQVQGPLFIKVDTEGFEAEIVPNWRPWLTSVQPTLFLSMHMHLRQYTRTEKERLAETISMFPHVYVVTDCLNCAGQHTKVNVTADTLCEKCDYLCTFAPSDAKESVFS